MESEGSDRPRIVFGGVGGIDPAWSPDGTRIAFISTHDSDLYITDMRDHSIRRITSTKGFELSPAWLP
jgi:Tol biopolymer transport system component